MVRARTLSESTRVHNHVLRHLLRTLQRVGEPGTVVTPGLICVAREVAKSEALDAPAALGRRGRRATQRTYDRVASDVMALFGPDGRFANSTLEPAESTYGALTNCEGADADGPCPVAPAHAPYRVDGGPAACFNCEVRLWGGYLGA